MNATMGTVNADGEWDGENCNARGPFLYPEMAAGGWAPLGLCVKEIEMY